MASVRWEPQRLIAHVEGAGSALVHERAERLADLAREEAPVRTGQLRDSIAVVAGPGRTEASVVASAPYAAFVEYGTRTQAPNPFLRRALIRLSQES